MVYKLWMLSSCVCIHRISTIISIYTGQLSLLLLAFWPTLEHMDIWNISWIIHIWSAGGCFGSMFAITIIITYEIHKESRRRIQCINRFCVVSIICMILIVVALFGICIFCIIMLGGLRMKMLELLENVG